ncbi:hypothetical protein LZK98_10145 [Sphingomonas cannabina]|uniref:hypothetical protein n=1 Tax=Sphingomonas cannabina TaxID=2899123 RepID=UPI001F32C8EE|nr:hypothetical protein [Sphingomonas cannabina]UIJ47269.1 hypothetical protein LZK98_10145 [Sphingomonas cannabina]
MIRWAALLPVLLLASCPPRPHDAAETSGAPDLETAAIARGIVRDPRDTEPTGLYARDTDRVCIVPKGLDYRIGAFVDYGEGITCNAAGSVTRSGETLRVRLGDGKCSFDARFDGDRITFPGRLPDACAALCTQRASLAGLEVTRLSESLSEAAAMRDARGRLPCTTR